MNPTIAYASRTSTIVTVLLALALVAGCEDITRLFRGEEPPPPPPKIEARPGWKYYVGGPVLVPDGFGRYRIGNFQGEVSKPSSRGFLVGVHRPEGSDDFELATWVNGRRLVEAKGYIGRSGIYFITERATVNAAGQVMTRQLLEYDDEAQVERSKLQHLDTETGEVVHTVETERPYAPRPGELDDEDDDDGFFDDVREGAPTDG